jgi:hypothetical protein
MLRAFIATVCLGAVSRAYAQTMPPAADMKLAHDIYKQFVEIQSGYTTGSTTPVAEAAAARLKEAGFATRRRFPSCSGSSESSSTMKRTSGDRTEELLRLKRP